jgi:hypothetical protein
MMNGPGSSYDAAGNLKTWNGAAYEYDRFNQMSRMTSGGEDWIRENTFENRVEMLKRLVSNLTPRIS